MARPRTPAGRARETHARLGEEYPDAVCALTHDGPFQLLEATILSAQCTDERVNLVTPALFARYPTPEDLAGADPAEVEALIKSTGFFRSKTKSLIGMASAVVERFGSQVPSALEDLVTLPGVGRKTGNVVRSVDMGLPGLPVDTHVGRLSRRLGITEQTDAVVIVVSEENGQISLVERARIVRNLTEVGLSRAIRGLLDPAIGRRGVGWRAASEGRAAAAMGSRRLAVASRFVRRSRVIRGVSPRPIGPGAANSPATSTPGGPVGSAAPPGVPVEEEETSRSSAARVAP